MTAWMPLFLRGLTVLLIVTFPSLVHAATLNVPSTAYPTIQAGVNASHDGDTVLVADGTYSGDGNRNIDFGGKKITVTSQNGPTKTVIDYKSSNAGKPFPNAFYIHSGENSQSVVQGFTITNDNNSGYGAEGIRIDVGSSPTIANCIFTNITSDGTAGMSVQGGGSPTITDCQFLSIFALDVGGISVYQSNITITNCTFSNNFSDYGDTVDAAYSTVIAINCTFSNNSGYTSGGISSYTGSIFLTNCVLHDSPNISNSSVREIALATSQDTASVNYSDIQGGYPGTANIDKDPLFVNASAGDLHLKSVSPCLGKGNHTGAPTTDLDGRPRPNPPSIGAYEAGRTLNVPSQYPTIQAGIDAALPDDTVLVADGTYTGNGNRDLDLKGKNITVMSKNGPTKTIIDCGGHTSTDGSGNHRGFYLHSGELNVTISGFTVENGYEVYNPNVTNGDSSGGGIFNGNDNNGTIKLNNCNIVNNVVSGSSGGGIFNFTGGTFSLTNCNITGNKADGGGGGIINAYDGAGVTLLANCTITKNISQSSGGGVFNEYHSGNSCILTNCTISENTANGTGGNENGGGGGIYNDSGGTMTLTNCTVTGNKAATDFGGGGIYERLTLSVLKNDILYGNIGGEIRSDQNPPDTVSYSDVQGGYSGIGNINADPLFVNASAGDLHLKPGSPCLGKGTHTGAPATDLDGKTRPNPPSMGAYDLLIPAIALSITSAHMISDHKLAVTTKRIFGTAAYSVTVSLGLKDASGKSLTLLQTLPGYNGLPDGDQNPFIFDFKQLNVPRFTKNQRFSVTAKVIKDSSGGYVQDNRDLIIWLPIVLVPGINGPADLTQGKNVDHPSGGDGTFPAMEAFLKQKSQSFLTANNCLGEPFGLFSSDTSYKYPTLATLPYDRDNDTFAAGAAKLTNLIGLIKLYTWADKVSIVTHSKGGLVARAYLQYQGSPQNLPESANTVNRLIMTVPPNTGSLEAKLDLISYVAAFNGGTINLSNLYPLWNSYRVYPFQKFIPFGKPNSELSHLDGTDLAAQDSHQMNLPPKINYTIIFSDTEPTPETLTLKQFVLKAIPYVGLTVGDGVVPYYSQEGFIYDPNNPNAAFALIHPFQNILINHVNVPGFHSAVPFLQSVSYLELPDVEAEVYSEISGDF